LVQGIPGLCFQGSSRELPSHSQELFLSHLLCCSPRMRIALLVQDDSAVDCLGPLVAKSCTVLGISSSGLPCAIFARRCAELGFDFTLSSDPAVAGVAVRSFKPEMVVSVSHGCQLSSVFADQAGFDSVKKFDLHIGSVTSEGAPWPEFPPIWLGHASSLVSLTALNEEKCLKGALSVAVTKDDTALSLRAKHAAAAAELLRMLLEGTDMPAASPPEAEVAVPVKAPDTISLKWDDGTADRYIRARYLPPHDPAVVKDPATGEGYFINDMHQYRTFCSKVLDSGSAQAEGKAKAYAADTHWYAYVCGNFVKVGDSDIHVPIRTSDRKRQAVIPGAAISGRKKLRMNEPLIGPNAEHYCASALASSWIGVEGPYVKQLERHLARTERSFLFIELLQMAQNQILAWILLSVVTALKNAGINQQKNASHSSAVIAKSHERNSTQHTPSNVTLSQSKAHGLQQSVAGLMEFKSMQFMEVKLGPFSSATDACSYCFSSFTKGGNPPAGPVAPACVCMAYPEDSDFNMFCATPVSAAGYIKDKGGCRCQDRDMESMGSTTCKPIQ